MPPRKAIPISAPLVVVRKKKTQQPTFGAAAKNGKGTTSAIPVPRPTPVLTTKPSPHTTASPQSAQSLSSPVQVTSGTPQSETATPRPNQRQRKAQAPYHLLAVFRARWPLAFPEDTRAIRPLMKGVHQEIAKLLPGTALWLIKRAIIVFQRLSGDAYWQAVLNGGPRYALDGSPCGEVLPQEQEHARQTLALWKQQRQAKRQAAAKENDHSQSSPNEGPAV